VQSRARLLEATLVSVNSVTHTPSIAPESNSVASGAQTLVDAATVAVLTAIVARESLNAGLGYAIWLGAPRQSAKGNLVVVERLIYESGRAREL
jgi:hypothetical protein